MAKMFSIEEKPNIKASFKISNEGTQNHNKLFNRDLPDQHPISSITGLQERLDKPTFPEMINGSGLQAPTSTPTFYGEKYLCRNEKKMYVVFPTNTVFYVTACAANGTAAEWRL